MQRLALCPQIIVSEAIQLIAYQGMVYAGKVHSDLMGTTRN